MTRCCLVFFLVCQFVFPSWVGALNEWTILVHMSSDDTTQLVEDINRFSLAAMKTISLPPGCEMVVLEDCSKPDTLHRLLGKVMKSQGQPSGGATMYCLGGRTMTVEQTLGEVNMGSPAVLWNFLVAATRKHPARRYALIFNGHGSGIFSFAGSGDVRSPDPGTVDFNPDRFVAYDATDRDCLTVFELGAVLRAFRDRLNQGRKLEVMAFDACLPGSIEALCQLHDVCEVFVGSADSIPVLGFPYVGFMARINRHLPANGEEFAAALRAVIMRKLGYWRTKQVPELVSGFDRLSVAILQSLEGETPVKLALGSFLTAKELYQDIRPLLKRLAREPVPGPGGAAIRQLAADTSDSLQRCWALPGGNPAKLSITAPPARAWKNLRKFYSHLAFAKATHWDEILDRLNP
ncbi:MAG: hypothetical protein GX442_22315 [Candidatus Riflebacteria bacterium]|nr:hypothetical protein [Candidatus Riflebacteria bacterium]